MAEVNNIRILLTQGLLIEIFWHHPNVKVHVLKSGLLKFDMLFTTETKLLLLLNRKNNNKSSLHSSKWFSLSVKVDEATQSWA